MTDQIITDQKLLRQLSKETTVQEVETLNLKRRLRKATKKAWTKGSGLAAIQIGIPLRFAWLTVFEKEDVLLNPEIIEAKGYRIYKNEGCLSIPNSWVDTMRYYYIKYISNGKIKEAINYHAILIQHEIDHMNGILNIDRVAHLENK